MIKSDLKRIDPTKEVLLIDFDQTIRNGGGTSGKIWKVIYQILEERGIDNATIESINEKTINEKKYGTYNFILAMCDNDIEKFNEFCKELFPRVDYHKVQQDKKLFKLLRKTSKKYNIYIFTNSHRSHVDICCKILFGVGIDDIDFMKCFDISETYENGKFTRKQDEGGLEKACERIGVNMNECILIDDSKKNIVVAASKGMRTIHIKRDKLDLWHVLKVLKQI